MGVRARRRRSGRVRRPGGLPRDDGAQCRLGLALLHGWLLDPQVRAGVVDAPHPEDFTRLTRDIYVPVSDVGFWQGTFRDPTTPEFADACAAIEARHPLGIFLLYGDHEGGQRVITRFVLVPRGDDGWLASVGRHWNVDRDDPR